MNGMNSKKRIFAVLLLSVVFLCACGNPYNGMPVVEREKADKLMREGGVIQMAHKTEDNTMDMNTNIVINEENVGKIKESGFWNLKVTYSNDGKNVFYVTDKSTKETKALEEKFADYDPGPTYSYYDMDGNCFGYCQYWYLPFGKNERHGVWVFLDEDGKNKGYYIDSNIWMSDWVSDGATIYTMEREKVGYIDFEKSFWSSYCTAEINLGESREALSKGDRVAVCICCSREIYDHYYT